MMNKKALIQSVQDSTGLDLISARRTVDNLLETLGAALERGERVELRGFGIFAPYITKPKVARNINLGEQILVPPRVKIRFRLTYDSELNVLNKVEVLAPAV